MSRGVVMNDMLILIPRKFVITARIRLSNRGDTRIPGKVGNEITGSRPGDSEPAPRDWALAPVTWKVVRPR